MEDTKGNVYYKEFDEEHEGRESQRKLNRDLLPRVDVPSKGTEMQFVIPTQGIITIILPKENYFDF